MVAMAGTSAAILDHDMTLSIEATLQGGGAEGLETPHPQVVDDDRAAVQLLLDIY